MAATQGSAAYQRLTVPEQDYGETARAFGQIGAANRRAQQELNQRNKELADQKKAKWEEEYGFNPDNFVAGKTGFNDFDEYHTDYAMYAADEYVKYHRQAVEAMQKGDSAKQREAEYKMQKIKNNFKLVSQSEVFYKQMYADYIKALDKREVSGASKDFIDIVESSLENGRSVIRHDKDGNLVNLSWDEQGNPLEPQRYKDVMQGNLRWVPDVKVRGKGGIVDDILLNLGTVSNDKNSGYFKITEQKWDDKLHGKAVEEQIGYILGNEDTMSDLLYKATNGQVIKRKNFTDEDYKTVEESLKAAIRAGYSEKYEEAFNASKYATDASAAKNKDKNEKYGVRKWNIEQVRDNGDVSMFASGDFEWNGTQYEATGASLVGDNIVIDTKYGEPITINRNSEIGLNDLFNAYEGETLEFDKVMTTKQVPWREERIGQQKGITDLLGSNYDSSGKFIGKEENVVDRLSQLYPNDDIKISRWKVGNVIKINGTEINLDQFSKDATEQKIQKALKAAPVSTGYKAQTSAGSR